MLNSKCPLNISASSQETPKAQPHVTHLVQNLVPEVVGPSRQVEQEDEYIVSGEEANAYCWASTEERPSRCGINTGDSESSLNRAIRYVG